MQSTFLLISPYEQGMTKGHLLIVLDVAQRLVARGHRVLVYTAAAARAEVEAAGAELVPHERYRELGARMHATYESMPGWLRHSRLLFPLRTLYVGLRFRRDVLASAMDFAEELEPILRRERVDCVVHDYLAFGAGYAAERLGIPSLTTGNAGVVIDSHGLPLNLRKSPPGRLACRVPGLVHRLMDVLLPLGRARRALGLPPRKARHAELFQTMASPELHVLMLHPGFLKGLPLRDNQLFAGPFAFDGGAREKSAPPPPPAPGTILVSTTTVGGDGGLLRRVLEAVEPMGLPVLATSTRDTDVPSNLGAHIRVERFVPHEQILPHVAAVVTHGGAGMVGRALRHGVPMLMIPLFAEQPLNAQLAQAQGIGYHLPFSQATPEAIRERLRALLEDRELHARLKQTAAEIQELCSKAVDIEAL
jgi:UDP:flavonoid glycosyltransferase YjiC (YdhE family)